jgi:hypothetical protein
MTDVHPGLVRLAEEMAATPDVALDSLGRPWVCERCPDPECAGAIIPAGTQGRLGHLMAEHGWRMDGRRWSNRNELVEVL